MWPWTYSWPLHDLAFLSLKRLLITHNFKRCWGIKICEVCVSDLGVISSIPTCHKCPIVDAEDDFLPKDPKLQLYFQLSLITHQLIKDWMVQVTCSDAYMWKQDRNSNTKCWFPVLVVPNWLYFIKYNVSDRGTNTMFLSSWNEVD